MPPGLAAISESGGIIAGIVAWMQSFAETPAAAISLFLFAFAESSFFPIPPDVLLIALCLTDGSLESFALSMWWATVCTVASTAGGAFGYWLGQVAGRPILRRLASPERIASVEDLLQRYDVWAIAAAGFTPIPYKIFTIASGLLRVKFLRFAVTSLLSRGARFYLVAVLCFAVGRPVREFLDTYFEWATLGFLALLIGGFVLVKYLAALYKKRNGPAAGSDRTS